MDMTRVLANGTFDIIHPGHIRYIEHAKALGDELIVIIANNAEKKTVMDADVRRLIIEALASVDRAILGHEKDKLKIVEDMKPDIIALGYDQNINEENLKKQLSDRGLYPKIIRLSHYSYDTEETRNMIRTLKKIST